MTSGQVGESIEWPPVSLEFALTCVYGTAAIWKPRQARVQLQGYHRSDFRNTEHF
jgi:hypothetical protein